MPSSKKKVQFITIITLISIIGVLVGVAALISVLSVFNGFNKYQMDILTGFDHIRVEPDSGSTMADYNNIIGKINSTSKVTAISPFTINKGVIKRQRKIMW